MFVVSPCVAILPLLFVSFCLLTIFYHLLYRIQRLKVPVPTTFTTPVKLWKKVLLTDDVFQIINLWKLAFTSHWKTKTALGRISMFLELLRYSSLNYLENKITGYCTCSIEIGNNIQKRPHANKKWLVWKPLVHKSTFPEGWCSAHTEPCLLFYRFYTWPVCNSVPDAISVQIVFCSKQQCIMNTHTRSFSLSLSARLCCGHFVWYWIVGHWPLKSLLCLQTTGQKLKCCLNNLELFTKKNKRKHKTAYGIETITAVCFLFIEGLKNLFYSLFINVVFYFMKF